MGSRRSILSPALDNFRIGREARGGGEELVVSKLEG